MAEEPTPVLIYAGATDGRFRFGVPRRDLTAEDVDRMDAALLKDITGGENPLYVKTGSKAAKAAAAAESGAKEG